MHILLMLAIAGALGTFARYWLSGAMGLGGLNLVGQSILGFVAFAIGATLGRLV